MSEETKAKQLKKALGYEPKLVTKTMPEEEIRRADAYCEGYKTFMDAAKTEREAAAEVERRALAAGYRPMQRTGVTYKAGDKVFYNNRGKAMLLATLGKRPLDEGVRLMVAHIDSPRLDLKPNPLYEDSDIALFKTHYYGGIRKYQWGATPLSLHGVVYRKDGAKVEVRLGEEAGDPVFCVTDLLPHLGAEQNKRTLADGLRGEELNIVVGSLPYADKELKERVKLYTLTLLNEKYGITERDFTRAELEAVPAVKASDVGFDRSMIGAYGHDDRVCAYTALQAELGVKEPEYTTVCILADKEEVGSDGPTGLVSDFVFHFLGYLADAQGANYKLMLQNAKCLSADVNAAFDPTFPDVLEKRNASYLNRGVVVTKYTGSRGKYGTNDASAEMMAYVTVPQIPARAPCHVQRCDEGAGHRCREGHRGDRLLGVPRHLDRLRHHGEGRQRLRPLRRVRLERRRDMGFGLPAFAQGPLCQRRARRGLLPLRYTQFDRFAPKGQDRRDQRTEGVHRRRHGRRADGLPPLRGAEHQEIHRRSQVPQRRQAHLIRWIRCA